MKLAKLITLASALAALASTAHATYINGSIVFGGALDITDTGSNVALDFGNNGAGTGPALVLSSNGSYSIVTPLITNATISDFSFTVPGYALTPATVNPLWTVTTGGFTFTLNSITGYTRTGSNGAYSYILAGTGVAYGTGFDATAGTWELNGAETGGTITFATSSSAASGKGVPDGGNLLVALGATLFGLVGFRRFSMGA